MNAGRAWMSNLVTFSSFSHLPPSFFFRNGRDFLAVKITRQFRVTASPASYKHNNFLWIVNCRVKDAVSLIIELI